MSLIEQYLIDGQNVPKPDFRAYLAAQEILSVKDPSFGVVGDDTADDLAALKDAQSAALELLAELNTSSVSLYYPDGSYLVGDWLPIVSGINHIGSSRKSVRIHCDGTGAAVATATYAGGVFSDNMDAILSEVTDSTRDVVNASIVDFTVEHTGAISGNAPSGAAWNAVVQLVGVADCLFRNIEVYGETDNIGAMSLKHSWRAVLENLYLPRQNAFTGGVALSLSSRCDNVRATRIVAFGDWDIGLLSDGCNGVTWASCDTELGCDVGIRMQGGSCIVVDNHYGEGCGTIVQVGTGGSGVANWEVRGGFFNDSEYGVDVVSGTRGECRGINFQGAFSGSFFKMTGTASFNYNNDFYVHVANAFTQVLSTLGLIGGRNRVHLLGEDGSGEELMQSYRSSDGALMHQGVRALLLTDGISAPGALTGVAHVYIDTADGDCKIKFADGVTKTLATDT